MSIQRANQVMVVICAAELQAENVMSFLESWHSSAFWASRNAPVSSKRSCNKVHQRDSEQREERKEAFLELCFRKKRSYAFLTGALMESSVMGEHNEKIGGIIQKREVLIVLVEAMQLFPSTYISYTAAFSSKCFCLPAGSSFALSSLAFTFFSVQTPISYANSEIGQNLVFVEKVKNSNKDGISQFPSYFTSVNSSPTQANQELLDKLLSHQ